MAMPMMISRRSVRRSWVGDMLPTAAVRELTGPIFGVERLDGGPGLAIPDPARACSTRPFISLILLTIIDWMLWIVFIPYNVKL